MAARSDNPEEWTGLEPELADDELALAAANDIEAMALLYRRYVGPVYRYCSRQLDPHTAEDVTSTVFLKVMNGIDQFKPSGAGFRSWLFAIAHHAVVDQHRIRTDLPIGEFDRHDRKPAVEDEAVLRDEMRRLRSALRQLPVDQRAVINLRLADLTSVEIAAVLSKTPGSVRVLQHRAILALRGVLASPDRSSDHD